jgi:hypothetical protein
MSTSASEAAKRLHFEHETGNEALHRFFGMRFSERGETLAFWKLSQPQLWHRVDRELMKIDRIRGMFRRDKEKAQLLENLRSALLHWRDGKVVKVHQRPDSALCCNADSIQSTGLQERLAYTKEIDFEPPMDDFDPRMDNIDVGVMHFRMGHGSLEGVEYHHPFCRGKFPNQKMSIRNVLWNTDHNPLVDCGRREDTINCFYFPANRMDWVEVSEPADTKNAVG